jgi:hypothetical protein
MDRGRSSKTIVLLSFCQRMLDGELEVILIGRRSGLFRAGTSHLPQIGTESGEKEQARQGQLAGDEKMGPKCRVSCWLARFVRHCQGRCGSKPGCR